MEARIAARLDPQQVVARLRRHVDGKGSQTASNIRSASAVVDNATFVIEGKRNPELFMPWELFERFVNATRHRGVESEIARARLSATLSTYGWVSDEFWPALDDITRLYIEAHTDVSVSNVSKGVVRGEGLLPRSNADQRQHFCAERSAALENARATFGQEAFDRFLYEVIAPGVTVFADVPMNAAEIRYITKGCQ